jgi:hypothetical protein
MRISGCISPHFVWEDWTKGQQQKKETSGNSTLIIWGLLTTEFIAGFLLGFICKFYILNFQKLNQHIQISTFHKCIKILWTIN